MPPKRKRAAAPEANSETVDAPATTTTAASKKTAAAPNKTTATAKRGRGKAKPDVEDTPDSDDIAEVEDPVPAKKRAKTTTTKASSSKPSATRAKSATLPLPPPTPINTPPAPPPKPAAPTNASDNAPYSDARARTLFNTYSDPDLNPTDAAVGAEGLEKLCADASIDMGGVQPLLLAWQFNSKVMGQVSKDEWLAATSKLRIDTPARFAALLGDLDEIVMTSKPVKAYKPKPSEVYNRDPINGYISDRSAAFGSFYNYCFNLAKGDGRNVELETACALWSVLLPAKFALAQPFIDWISEKKAVKGVNKDLWSMLLEFFQSVDSSLSNFDNDGAWPTAIDDFVEWKKSKA